MKKIYCSYEGEYIEVEDNFDCDDCENLFNCQCALDEENRRWNEEIAEIAEREEGGEE